MDTVFDPIYSLNCSVQLDIASILEFGSGQIFLVFLPLSLNIGLNQNLVFQCWSCPQNDRGIRLEIEFTFLVGTENCKPAREYWQSFKDYFQSIWRKDNLQPSSRYSRYKIWSFRLVLKLIIILAIVTIRRIKGVLHKWTTTAFGLAYPGLLKSPCRIY